METSNCESVSINMEVYDETNKGAAAYTNSCSRRDTNESTFRSPRRGSSETRDLQTTHSGDAGAGNSETPAVDIEEIELMDMKGSVEIDNSQRGLSEGEKQSLSKTRADLQPSKLSTDKEQSEESGSLLSSVRQFSNPGSPRRTASSNDQLLSTESGILLSPTRQRNSPESPHRTVVPSEQSKSSLSVPGQPWKQQSRQTKSKHRPRVGAAQNNDDCDDDDDISMDSLMELLGTVRQYAKEIHEIYAPIKKDEEERIRKRNEQNARRKSKEKGKSLVCRSNSEVTSPVKHEVRVEIHTPDNTEMEDLRQKCSRQSKQDVLSHSRSHEPLSTNQIASLHVENEKLASTWPRGNRRAASSERFWSDVNTSSQRSPKPSGSVYRPQIPPSWSGLSRVRQEQEISEKTLQRPRKPSNDPLAMPPAKTDSFSKKLPVRPLQTRGTNPAVPDHRTLKQALPQISIIPASFDYKTTYSESLGGSLPSSLPDNNTSTFPSPARGGDSQRDDIIRTASVVSGDDRGSGGAPDPPLDGADAAKSVSRAGLRKRKSVDKGLGQHVVLLEKY